MIEFDCSNELVGSQPWKMATQKKVASQSSFNSYKRLPFLIDHIFLGPKQQVRTMHCLAFGVMLSQGREGWLFGSRLCGAMKVDPPLKNCGSIADDPLVGVVLFDLCDLLKRVYKCFEHSNGVFDV